MTKSTPLRARVARREPSSRFANIKPAVQFDPANVYIDTIEIFLRPHPPVGLRAELERIIGKRVRIVPCRDRDRIVRGFRVCLNQPSARLILHLQRRLHDWPHHLHALGIACDHPTSTPAEATAAGDCLKQLCLLHRRRRGPLQFIGDTCYWASRTAARNLVVYADKVDRFDNTTPVAHLELRFQNAGALRRAKIRLGNLHQLDLPAIVSHNVRMVEIDQQAAERIKARRLRRLVAKERRQFLAHRNQRAQTAFDPYAEQPDCQLPEFRAGVKQLIENELTEQFRYAQTIKDSVIKQRILSRNISIFSMPPPPQRRTNTTLQIVHQTITQLRRNPRRGPASSAFEVNAHRRDHLTAISGGLTNGTP